MQIGTRHDHNMITVNILVKLINSIVKRLLKMSKLFVFTIFIFLSIINCELI